MSDLLGAGLNSADAAARPVSEVGTKSGHYLELDGMRGVLATTVMLFHLGLNTLIANLTRGTVHDGQWPLCVDFFFALSGFVLCRSFVLRRPDVGAFGIKRLFRLAPMYLATTLFVLAMPGMRHWSELTVGANLLIIQSLIRQPSINFVSWSIPFELVLPAAGLLAIGSVKRIGAIGLWSLLCLLLALEGLVTYRLADGADLQWGRAGLGLAAGAVLYLVRDVDSRRALTGSTTLSMIGFGGAVLIMALSGRVPMLALGFPICAAVAIWFGAESRGVFTFPPIAALGRWSYSIYLLHIPILFAANALLGAKMVNGHSAIKLAIVIVVLTFSGVCYRFVEAPMIALGGTLAGGKRPRRASGTTPDD